MKRGKTRGIRRGLYRAIFPQWGAKENNYSFFCDPSSTEQTGAEEEEERWVVVMVVVVEPNENVERKNGERWSDLLCGVSLSPSQVGGIVIVMSESF